MLLDIHAQTGVLADELASAPVPPEETAYLWRWFCEIAAGRQSGMAPNPLMHGEIDVWFRQRGIRPAEWELKALRGLDAAWLVSLADDSVGKVGSAASLGRNV